MLQQSTDFVGLYPANSKVANMNPNWRKIQRSIPISRVSLSQKNAIFLSYGPAVSERDVSQPIPILTRGSRGSGWSCYGGCANVAEDAGRYRILRRSQVAERKIESQSEVLRRGIAYSKRAQVPAPLDHTQD
jgi:hypothetical protein